MVEGTCKNLDTALTTGLESPSVDSTFEYCTGDNGVFLQRVTTCHTCLKHMEGYRYVSNCKQQTVVAAIVPFANLGTVVTALEAGCRQLPGPAQLISLDGSLFSSDPVNATEPRFENTVVSTQESDGLDVGAILGIVIAALFFIIVVLSIGIIQMHKRRRSRYQQKRMKRYQPRFGMFGNSRASAPKNDAYMQDHEKHQHQWGEKPAMFAVEMKEVPSRSPSPVGGSIYTKASNPSSESLSETGSPEQVQQPATRVSITKHRPSLSIITNAPPAPPPIPSEPLPQLPVMTTISTNPAESRPRSGPIPPTMPVSGPPNPLRMNSYRSSTAPTINVSTFTPDTENPYNQPFPFSSPANARSNLPPPPHFVFPQRATNTPPPAFHRPLTATGQLPAYNPSTYSSSPQPSRSTTPLAIVSPPPSVGLGISTPEPSPGLPPSLPPRSQTSTPQLLATGLSIPHPPPSNASSRAGTPQLLPNGLPVPPPPPGPPPSGKRSASVGRSHSFRPVEQQREAFQNIASWLAAETADQRGAS
jgi:hypothetical protein